MHGTHRQGGRSIAVSSGIWSYLCNPLSLSLAYGPYQRRLLAQAMIQDVLYGRLFPSMVLCPPLDYVFRLASASAPDLHQRYSVEEMLDTQRTVSRLICAAESYAHRSQLERPFVNAVYQKAEATLREP